jgi:hypothetical protein
MTGQRFENVHNKIILRFLVNKKAASFNLMAGFKFPGAAGKCLE